MTTRRFLILAPTVLILFLLQSYYWVPTYEQQTRGNPHRLNEYITASIGDASILNPILSADKPSSDIESLVFEGLIDRDEELRFRGRLASSWEIHEEAYFYVNEQAVVPGLGRPGAGQLAAYIRKTGSGDFPSDPGLEASLRNIREIYVLDAGDFEVTREEKGRGEENGTEEVRIRVSAPARIKMILNDVDQDLFENLLRILGEDYFSGFEAERFVTVDREEWEAKRPQYAQEILPPFEHNPVVTFHLRGGVKFHDGHIFDANDVKFTCQSIMNPRNISPRFVDYEPIKLVDVVDPLTVRIVYKRLYSPALGTWAMGILPEHLLNDDALKIEAIRLGKDPDKFTMRQSGFNRRPVGCGPFVFQEWKSDQYVSLRRFDDYWEGPPNYEDYIYRIVPDVLTQEMEFYAGTIDSYDVQPHQVDRLRDDPTYQDFSGVSFGYTYIGYNMRREPFNDPRVRVALGMAIDIDKIIKYVLFGQGERITGPFVKQTDYYNHSIQPIAYDPDRAMRLLEEAGWRRNSDGRLEKDGKKFQFTLITNSGNPLREALLAIVQDAWKKIGVDVRTDRVEWAVFIEERVDKADFDAIILGWSMGIEPDLYQIWHSSQTDPYELNFVGFRNSETDDLIIKIRQEYDHDSQVEYCHRLHEIIAGEQPYTFLYVTKWTAVLDRRIVIKDGNAEGVGQYRKITPTKTGNFMFYFNKWVKLAEVPSFTAEG